jgi:uncharacterized protein (TIGR02391 family)
VSLIELLPNPDDALKLEPEELAGYVLAYLASLPDHYTEAIERDTFILDRLLEGYSMLYRKALSNALAEAWVWLEREGFLVATPFSRGDFVFLSRRGKRIRGFADFVAYRRVTDIPVQRLHPLISQKVWPHLLHGDWETAVFIAFKEVEVAVRAEGGHADLDVGVGLMRKAFDVAHGSLVDLTQPLPEREAISHLFAGAIGLYKNPSSHRRVQFSDHAAVLEVLLLASHLLRLIDERVLARKGGFKP